MATGTSTKEGGVPTFPDKDIDYLKVPSDAGTRAHGKGQRRSLRGTTTTPKTMPIALRLSPLSRTSRRASASRRGKKDAEANGASPTASSPEGKPPAEPQVTSGEVDALVGHRVDKRNSTVEFKVRWKGSDETSWEPERNLQEDVPTLVYKYWAGLGGRDTATRLKSYHVFKILKPYSPPVNSKDSQYTHVVQWVGYPLTKTTPECESKLRRIAPQKLKEFEAKELKRETVKSQKRKNSRGPGRPRKKARGVNNQ